MTHQNAQTHHGGRKTLLALAVAAAIASGLGLLFGTRKGEEIQEDIKAKASNLAKGFKKTREEVQNRLKNFFEDVSEDIEQAYVEVEGNLLTELDARSKKNPLTEREYNKLVDSAVKEFSKGREWSKDKLKKLGDSLREDWKEIKDTVS